MSNTPVSSRRRLITGGIGAQPSSGDADAKNGSTLTTTPPLAVRTLHRMGFGPARRKKKPAPAAVANQLFGDDFEVLGELGVDDIGYFMSLGKTDDQRLANYVDQQLNPTSIDDSDLNARLAAYPASFSTLNQSLATVFSQRACQTDYDTRMRPVQEVERAAFTRAIYSRRQLFELTVDFWHNHFNVFSELSGRISASWHSWDRDVIRAHAFGNFYQFLYATARHVTMLHYLDNYRSSASFNENYAREVMELHTLGAEHYLGLALPGTVPALAENPYTALKDPELDNPTLGGGVAIADPNRLIAARYVDSDVYEAARTLTGWRYNNANTANACGTGAFYTDPSQHAGSSKSVLGRGSTTHWSELPVEDDGRITLKMLAWHPATAKHIARKLCRRLIADEPPESVVEAAAATFFANRQAPDQIGRTLRTILTSPEFKDPALWGSKTKRPFEAVVSAMRVAGCNHTFRHGDTTNPQSNTTSAFLYEYNRAGHQLFWWRTPDGYPDTRSFWQGSNTMVRVWRAIDWLSDRDASSPSQRVLRILDLTHANLQGNPSAREVVEFWLEWIMGFAPDGGWTGPPGTLIANAPTTLGEAALRFFTQTYASGSPDRTPWGADEPSIPRTALENDNTEYRWNTRLRGLVALILWSPNFMQR